MKVSLKKRLKELSEIIKEQKQIVEFLNKETEKIDTTIEKETQRIELLKEYHQSNPNLSVLL